MGKILGWVRGGGGVIGGGGLKDKKHGSNPPSVQLCLQSGSLPWSAVIVAHGQVTQNKPVLWGGECGMQSSIVVATAEHATDGEN